MAATIIMAPSHGYIDFANLLFYQDCYNDKQNILNTITIINLVSMLLLTQTMVMTPIYILYYNPLVTIEVIQLLQATKAPPPTTPYTHIPITTSHKTVIKHYNINQSMHLLPQLNHQQLIEKLIRTYRTH
jgi:hypothetical protein